MMQKLKWKNLITKMTDKKWKVGFLIAIVGIVSLTLLFAITRGVSGFLSSYTEEIRSIDFESSDWSSNGKGSIHVNKSIEWIDKGTAKLKYTINSNAAIDEVNSPSDYGIDAIFVVDTSTSMQGEKIEKAKEDINSLASEILKDENNKVALINFSTNASTLSSFTNNKSVFTSSVNNLNANGLTNYEKGLKQVSTLLDGYTVPDNHDVMIFFLTDGAPTSKNHKSEYIYLKQKYPNMIVNAIQYELGKEIIPETKNISDYQFYADKENLYETLLASYKKASSESSKKIYYSYENFTLTDYLTDEFEVDNDNITTLDGKATYDNTTNQITWNLDDFKTSNTTTMEVTLKVKEGTTINNHKYLGQAEKTEVSYKLPNQVNAMTVNTTKTPVLRLGYDVTYETNIPTDCSNTLIAPTKGTYLAFDTITKSLENLECDNYLFKGWEVTDDTGEDVEFLTDDSFVMPEHDVVVRAIWSSLSIAKTQEGEVAIKRCKATKFALTGEMAYCDDGPSEFVTSETGINFFVNSSDTNGKGIYIRAGTENDEHPIYYYRGAVTNNNVLFANYCWKIVRTTETGGIKLIYNGVPTTNNRCTDMSTVQVGRTVFNDSSNNGYMYDDSTIIQHGEIESDIKKIVDSWYEENIENKGYTKYLEDAVWCNDRTIGSISGIYTYYSTAQRLSINKETPLVKDIEVCSNKEDRYTVDDVTKGNGALTYPVALLTADEAFIAGMYQVGSTSYLSTGYLGTGYQNISIGFWTMSPGTTSAAYIVTNAISWDGEILATRNTYVSQKLDAAKADNSARPSIVLKKEKKFIEGNGELETPYIVDTSS